MNTFDNFKNNLPDHTQYTVLNHSTENGLHIASWPLEHFDNLSEFVEFTFRFSSVIQPYVCDPDRDDLEGWFYEDDSAEQGAKKLILENPVRQFNFSEWLEAQYPTVNIEWINGDHSIEAITLGADEPELTGKHEEGFFHIFTADET